MSNRHFANLGITIYTNEGLAQPVVITTSTNGTLSTPNLTGAEFRSGVMTSLLANATPVCNLTVSISNAAAGEITLRLSANTARTLTPGNYVYDVLMKLQDAEIYRAWSAPFIVLSGVTSWD